MNCNSIAINVIDFIVSTYIDNLRYKYISILGTAPPLIYLSLKGWRGVGLQSGGIFAIKSRGPVRYLYVPVTGTRRPYEWGLSCHLKT